MCTELECSISVVVAFGGLGMDRVGLPNGVRAERMQVSSVLQLVGTVPPDLKGM